MKLIEVDFSGGLGNQLFQYATARALMKKGDLLLINLSSYNDDYLGRHFKLFNYNIKGSVIYSNWLKKGFIPETKFNFLLQKLGIYSQINENGFFIHKDLKKKIKLFTRIRGFWQSELYFNTIRNDLVSEIKPKVIPTLPHFFKLQNTVAVHIRRADYLNDLRYGFIGENYYWNAIYLIKQKVVNPYFIFFSDDMQWCKHTFKEEAMFFSDDFYCQEDYYQLFLMSQCNHQIVANSSFSWWGAWLNEYQNKLVIRPIKPFNDSSLFYENYYPSEWIAI